MKNELSDEQIAQQDFVDNKIFEMVNELVPEKFRLSENADVLEFSADWIGDVRDKLNEIIAELFEITPGTLKADDFEKEFYPYFED